MDRRWIRPAGWWGGGSAPGCSRTGSGANIGERALIIRRRLLEAWPAAGEGPAGGCEPSWEETRLLIIALDLRLRNWPARDE